MGAASAGGERPVVTRAWFDGQMSRLLGLKFMPGDMTTHWEALREIPDDVLEAAVTRSQRTRVEFPTPVELRQDADLIVRLPTDERDDPARRTPLAEPKSFFYPQIAQTIQVREEWQYDCDACSDSGWLSCWCGPFTSQRKPWQEPRTCDRKAQHGSHEWVRPCACSATNPTLIRKREAQRKYADAAVKK